MPGNDILPTLISELFMLSVVSFLVWLAPPTFVPDWIFHYALYYVVAQKIWKVIVIWFHKSHDSIEVDTTKCVGYIIPEPRREIAHDQQQRV